MPLGIDSPSTIGMAVAVLGPAFIAAKARMPADAAAILAWQVGMATIVLIGVFKVGIGPWLSAGAQAVYLDLRGAARSGWSRPSAASPTT